MRITELIEELKEIHDAEGDLEVYFVNDQYEAEPIRGAYKSIFAEGGSFSGDRLGPINEEDAEGYEDTFIAVELQ